MLVEGGEFGPYVIDKELGTGGMASVWRAFRKDHEPDHQVVLKMMLPHIGRHPRFVDMFVREAVLSAELCHPNLVAVYDMGLLENQYFIEMEYVPGRTIRQALRRTTKLKAQLPMTVTLAAMADCCDALAYIHDARDDADRPRRLVHRDVSPENIMLGFDGVTKLLDFGIATLENESFTTVGERKGKMHYMPPEAFRSAPAHPSRDIYAIGAMLYELLVGRRPFRGKDEAELMFQISEGRLIAPSRLRDDLPAVLDEAIVDTLARDPAQRPANAAILGRTLRDVLGELDGRPSTMIVAEAMQTLFPQDGEADDSSIPDESLATLDNEDVVALPEAAEAEAAGVSPPAEPFKPLERLDVFNTGIRSRELGESLLSDVFTNNSSRPRNDPGESLVSDVFTLSTISRRRERDENKGPSVFSLYERIPTSSKEAAPLTPVPAMLSGAMLPRNGTAASGQAEAAPEDAPQEHGDNESRHLALVHFERGLEHRRSGRLTSALAEWELAAELDPANRTIITNVRILKGKME